MLRPNVLNAGSIISPPILISDAKPALFVSIYRVLQSIIYRQMDDSPGPIEPQGTALGPDPIPRRDWTADTLPFRARCEASDPATLHPTFRLRRLHPDPRPLPFSSRPLGDPDRPIHDIDAFRRLGYQLPLDARCGWTREEEDLGARSRSAVVQRRCLCYSRKLLASTSRGDFGGHQSSVSRLQLLEIAVC